ncbi:MAG: response regulator [Pseudobacteriovorax sp.]|nr:response regulator [Pseudobacteriovorax sp.]
MPRVLLVDNEVDVIETFQFVVEQSMADFDFVYAQSGYDAMQEIEQSKPDLVLTDYRMDQGDGASLAHYCNHQSISCVILTGFSASDVIPYVPEGTLVMKKLDILRQGRLKELITSMISTAT